MRQITALWIMAVVLTLQAILMCAIVNLQHRIALDREVLENSRHAWQQRLHVEQERRMRQHAR